ncbi:MAG: PEP-CTERM sorting domain-containing protein [Planctomycetales bacterium]|nr:PEP-CTERM sorting domain-containing protein [Planctomycetales bacterium]
MRIVFAALVWAALGIAQANAGFDFFIQTFDAAGTTLQSTFNLGDTVTVKVSAVDNLAGAGPNVSSGGVIGGGWRILSSTTDVDDFSSFTTPFASLSTSSGVPSSAAGTTFSFIGGGPAAGSPVVLGQFQYVVNVAGNTDISFNAAANNGLIFGATNHAATNLTGATVTAVPEPSSLALLGLGCTALAFRRRR